MKINGFETVIRNVNIYQFKISIHPYIYSRNLIFDLRSIATVPSDNRGKRKDVAKLNKYLNLAKELKNL